MLPSSALRPFIFAKIHGIFSRFRTPETLLNLLQGGSTEHALSGLALDVPVSSSQIPLEFKLHQALFTAMVSLIPVKGGTGRFFLSLISEYEARNVAVYLKKSTLDEQDLLPLPPRHFPLTSLLHNAQPATAEKILSHTQYATATAIFRAEPDTALLDKQLEQEYFQRLYHSTCQLRGRDRSHILPLLERYLDTQTTIRALRLQHYYQRSPEQAVNGLFFYTRAEQRRLQSMLETEVNDPTLFFPRSCRNGISEAFQNLKQTTDDNLEQFQLPLLEHAAALYLQKLFHKHFYLAHMSLAPLFCFYFLLKREILNTALLCNSIRFEVSPETFRQELVY